MIDTRPTILHPVWTALKPCAVIARLEAISPEDLEQHVAGQDIGVTVYRDGMLPLPPRLPYDQLPNTLAAYAHEME